MSKVVEINATTGKIVERDLTKEEIQQVALDKAAYEERIAAIESKQAARLALLNKLGITQEEAQLLLA